MTGDKIKDVPLPNLQTQSQDDLISLVDYHKKRYTDIQTSWQDLNKN